MKILSLFFLIPIISFSQTVEVKYYNNQIFNSNQTVNYIPREIKPNYVQNHYSYTLLNSNNISLFKNDKIIEIVNIKDTISEIEMDDNFGNKIIMIEEKNTKPFNYSSKENITFKNFNSNVLEFTRKLENKIVVKDSLINLIWILIEGRD